MNATPTVGAQLRAARLSRHLTQQQAAREAAVTQAHVSLIERGMDVHYSVLKRLAAAVGLELTLEPIDASGQPDPYGDDEIANRIYQLGRLAATRLTPERMDRFRSWIENARARHGDYPYFRDWLKVCDAGPKAVAALLCDPTERGRYMRAVASLRPFVTQAERDAYYQPVPPVPLL